MESDYLKNSNKGTLKTIIYLQSKQGREKNMYIKKKKTTN